jgi:hypothetical protein
MSRRWRNRSGLRVNNCELAFSHRLFTRFKIFLHESQPLFSRHARLIGAFSSVSGRALLFDPSVKLSEVSKRVHHPPEAKNSNSAEYGSCIG